MSPYLSTIFAPVASVLSPQRPPVRFRNTRRPSRSEMPVSCFDVLRFSTWKPEPPAAM